MWVRHMLIDEGFDAVCHVILHEPPPLAIPGLVKGIAEANGASKLWLQNGVSACCQKLRSPVEAKSSRPSGPSWGMTTRGNVLLAEPAGVVRYAGISVPSRAL